jgi:hypothetical protein
METMRTGALSFRVGLSMAARCVERKKGFRYRIIKK